jgi:hypothetical protein
MMLNENRVRIFLARKHNRASEGASNREYAEGNGERASCKEKAVKKEPSTISLDLVIAYPHEIGLMSFLEPPR